MAYGYFKYFNRRTAADKVLRGKEFNIAKKKKRWISTCTCFNGYEVMSNK